MEEKTLRDEFAMSAPPIPGGSILTLPADKQFPAPPWTDPEEEKRYNAWANGIISEKSLSLETLASYQLYAATCNQVLIDNEKARMAEAARIEAQWAYLYADACMERRKT